LTDAHPLEFAHSALTANIYYPAIPVISRDFHKSVELINLTVTMYMAMQGVCAPFIISPNRFTSDDYFSVI